MESRSLLEAQVDCRKFQLQSQALREQLSASAKTRTVFMVESIRPQSPHISQADHMEHPCDNIFNQDKSDSYDNAKIERLLEGSWSVFWIKMASCWVCLFLYMWTLVAPMLFPKRFEA